MIKYLVFIVSLLLFQIPAKAQLQMFIPQDVEVTKYTEAGGHMFALGKLRGNDTCSFFFLSMVSTDFYLIAGLCQGESVMDRYITDDDLRNLLETDSEQRREQQHPEKPDSKSKEHNN